MVIDRLQGTDGVRGPIILSESCSTSDPISAFLNEGFLTEEFFELYIYAYCMELLEADFAKTNDSVVIGCDPREFSEIFYKSAIRGIRKAGLKAVLVEVLPTPAISLYQMHIRAVCGFVLTASHNPLDQNGIKVFLGYSNLKLFPEDDKKLTKRCLKIDFDKLQDLPIIGEYVNEHMEARGLFKNFMKNYENNWIINGMLDRSTVIVDCANGSFSNIINELFKFKATDFYVTNCDVNAGINFRSGVADLEGVKKIFPDHLQNGVFSDYKALALVLKKGREKRNILKGCKDMVYGIVLDGDGDRCFLLIYDPFQDCILVLGGDVLAFFQSKYLFDKYYCGSEHLFVNTIESDVNALYSAEKIGYKSSQCAVGDKWILWQAFYSQLQSKLYFYEKIYEETEFQHMLRKTKKNFQNMIEYSKLSALNATKTVLDLENWILENKGKVALENASNFLCERSNNYYAIGSEESGHLVNLAIMSSRKNKIPVFIGNGLKCGINSIVAIQALRLTKNSNEIYEWLNNPFPGSYKKTLQVYYVDKSLLSENSRIRKKLIKFLLDNSKWPGIEVKLEKIFEDPEMLILRAYEGKTIVGSIFVRNSGTEDKMVVYLRGMEGFASHLDEFSKKMYPFLLAYFKNQKNPMVRAEIYILQSLAESSKHISNLNSKKLKDIPVERLLNEMSSRQNLISRDGQKLRITRLGIELLNCSERS